MKKNDLILIASVAIYSYLFYAQSAGINFLLFNIILLIGLLLKDRSLIKNKAWLFTASASIISGLCVLIYGSTLAVFTNILSLSLAGTYSLSKESSLVFTIVLSAFNYISSIYYIVVDFVARKKASETETAYAKILITIVPLLITIVFYFIYREANPLFKNFTKELNLDFITWDWIGFTLLGFILIYGFYYPRKILLFLHIDLISSDNLSLENLATNNISKKLLTINHENTLGIVLFVFLNILLLMVNTLDINYVWISQTLPVGLSYSDFVHQGINMLITSIVVAILIILYFFRGSINFYKNNTAIKVLAYIWIIQNAIMILSGVIKNDLYISEYGLTYKRIGVYVYLLLSLIGLATTFIKIVKLKTNWFLFRKNAWAFYTILILSCLFNWDLIIAEYNTSNPNKGLDKPYLISLSDTVLPKLLKLKTNEPDSNTDSNYDNNLLLKKHEFLQRWEESDWQSWNWDDYKTYEEIKSHNL
jgi:hypothetical protein